MYVFPEVFVLLGLFIIKHFLADYPLQNSYMLRKFAGGWDWVLPLGSHCAVHAGLTVVILSLFSAFASATQFGYLNWQKVGLLASLDFAVHFVMDRIKASPKLLGRYKTLNAKEMQKAINGLRSHSQKARFASRKNLKHNKYFWWSLGFDQSIHHLTDLVIVYFVFSWGLQ